MAKIILSINAGSSSVKISVYKTLDRTRSPSQLVETQIAGLTAPPSTFSYENRSSKKIKNQQLAADISSQDEAFKYMLDHLVDDKDTPEIQRRDDIVFACHRIVHGGDYEDAQIITSETYHHLEQLTDLAPLYVLCCVVRYIFIYTMLRDWVAAVTEWVGNEMLDIMLRPCPSYAVASSIFPRRRISPTLTRPFIIPSRIIFARILLILSLRRRTSCGNMGFMALAIPSLLDLWPHI